MCLRYIIILLLFVNTIANKTFAQFYIGENTSFFLNDTLSSGEKHNTIEVSLSGKGTLVFNSHKTSQNLNTKDNISIHDVNVNTKTSFSFYNAFHIENDFVANADILRVFSPIWVKGKFILGENSQVLGHDLIINSYKILPLNSTQSLHQNSFQHLVFFQNEIKTKSLPLIFYHKQHHFYFKDISINLLAANIPTPPPKYLSCVVF